VSASNGETIVVLVIAVCLIATVIWAADRYLVLPAPFGWVKGILIFVLIVVACYFLWDTFVAGHLVEHRLRR
jgi:hypothetical protein